MEDDANSLLCVSHGIDLRPRSKGQYGHGCSLGENQCKIDTTSRSMEVPHWEGRIYTPHSPFNALQRATPSAVYSSTENTSASSPEDLAQGLSALASYPTRILGVLSDILVRLQRR